MDKIELKEISIDQKGELISMLRAYFKEIDPVKIIQFEGESILDYPYLDSYWEEEDRYVFAFKLKEETIGFALLNNWTVHSEFNADQAIAEFYIKPKWRNKGFGKKSAFLLFEKFNGKWEVKQNPDNKNANKFWRTIIAQFTNDNFIEVEIDVEDEMQCVQLFEF